MGTFLGNTLAKNELLPFQQNRTYSQAAAEVFSLKAFDPVPPGTLGERYLRNGQLRRGGTPMNKKGLMVALVLSLAINISILEHPATIITGIPGGCDPPLAPYPQLMNTFTRNLASPRFKLSQMEPLAKKFHERLTELRKGMKGKNTRLVELLSQKEIDQVQVQGLRKEMADIQDEIQKEVIAHIIESKKIFDPKQQERS